MSSRVEEVACTASWCDEISEHFVRMSFSTATPVIAISLTENRRHQSRCDSAEFSVLRLPTDKEGLSQAEHSAVCRHHRLESPPFRYQIL
jgi:hypothetical protein